jgi:hypothetical protein
MTTLDDEPSTLDAELQKREKFIVDKMLARKYKKLFERIENSSKFKNELNESKKSKEVQEQLGKHLMKLGVFIDIV